MCGVKSVATAAFPMIAPITGSVGASEKLNEVQDAKTNTKKSYEQSIRNQETSTKALYDSVDNSSVANSGFLDTSRKKLIGGMNATRLTGSFGLPAGATTIKKTLLGA